MSEGPQREAMPAFPKSEAETVRWEQTHAACLAMLHRDPEHVPSLHFLGRYAIKAGHLDRAVTYLAKAHALLPASADIRLDYAMVLLMRKDIPEAVGMLRQVVEGRKDFAGALFILANTLKDFGHDTRRRECLEEAVGYYEQLLRLQPDHFGACNNLGVTYQHLARLEEAQHWFERALALDPTAPEPLNNLGITTRLRGFPEQSAASCRKALALRPAYPEAQNNLGNALKDMDDLAGARAAYEQAIALRPDPDFRCNLALVLLAQGHFAKGWAAYEWRKAGYELKDAQPHLRQPMWQGQEAAGKTLLLHSEQGFGDTIQFCRYASLAADRGMRVILNVPAPLTRLMGTVRGVSRVLTSGEPLPPFDFHCPMLSLPLAFGTELATIPASAAYLAASRDDSRTFARRIEEAGITGFKVGLVWSGRPREDSADLMCTDRKRSLDPSLLAPLLTMGRHTFFQPPERRHARARILGPDPLDRRLYRFRGHGGPGHAAGSGHHGGHVGGRIWAAALGQAGLGAESGSAGVLAVAARSRRQPLVSESAPFHATPTRGLAGGHRPGRPGLAGAPGLAGPGKRPAGLGYRPGNAYL